MLRGLVALIVSVSASAQFLLANAPAGYPRVALSNGNATAFAVVEAPAPSGGRSLQLKRRDNASPNAQWINVAAIVVDKAKGVDLANGNLLSLPDGTLLCAYRHHSPSGGSTTYRIQVSRSLDNGTSWFLLSTVASGPIGVWEPYLYTSPTNASVLRVLYSAELTNGGEQDVVQQSSTDGGASWGAVDARVHYAPGGRNGMPGVALLGDGSMVMVFERPIGPPWGHFSVNFVQSVDGGATWGPQLPIHTPSVASGFNAGSPQVAYCPGSATVVAVYMSDEATPPQVVGSGWPDSARVWVSYGSAVGSSVAAVIGAAAVAAPVLNWTAGAPVQGTGTDFIYWPGVFYDVRARSLHVVYQGSDGAAWLDAKGGALVPVC